MKNKNQEKQNNSLGAVATGVVIGAGVAAAGAAILHDKKNREKVKKVVKDVKKQVSGYMEDIQKRGNEKKEEGKDVLKKKTEESIDSAQNTLEDAKKNL
jgi:hypothetical protein